MAKIVETPLARIRWPAVCCRCASSSFRMCRQTENVVVWTVLGVTAYRKISLEAPVCGPCQRRSVYWLGGAALLVAAVLATGQAIASDSPFAGLAMGLFLALAVAMVMRGLRSRPLNILEFYEKDHSVQLRIFHDGVADALVAAGAREGVYKPVRRRYLLALVASTIAALAAAWYLG